MKRGHPILGAVTGLLFGISLAVTLLVFGVLALDSILVAVLPVLFLLLGGVWGKLAPIGRAPA
jgi:hypothetical protein